MNNPADPTQMSIKTWALLILLAAIWGGSFLFGRIAVLEVPVFTLVMLRVAIAAICLWLFIVVTGRKIELSWWLITNVAILGLINNAMPFSFIAYGQTEIGSGLASLVNAMTPIWTLLIANWMTSDEKISTAKSVGILFGFCGVAVLMGGDIWLGLTASALAQFSVLLATVCYGFSSVFGKRFKQVDPMLIAACQLTAATLYMTPIAFAIDAPLSLAMPSQIAILSIIALGILCTAIAYVMFFKILREAGAVNVSLVTFLVPVSAIILGMIVLNEKLTVYQIGGMILIAAGLVILDGRLIAKVNNNK